MSKRLFIGGLSWSTTEEGLRAAFESFGELEDVKIITDRDTGRSRGFGFVGFTAADAAAKAMDEMNGAELDGRTLRVDLAQQGRREGGEGGRGGEGGGGRR